MNNNGAKKFGDIFKVEFQAFVDIIYLKLLPEFSSTVRGKRETHTTSTHLMK
jgi:hypothetical protein